MNRIRILSQQNVLELMTIRDAILPDEKAYCQKATESAGAFATSMLFDIQKVRPIEIINAGALTGTRTGAAAVGAKYLARADVSSLLRVGTGIPAAYAIAAILLVCPLIQSVSLGQSSSPGKCGGIYKYI